MAEGVRFEVADGVGTIMLDRPDRLNALDLPMHEALEEAVAAAFRADDARVILLAGEGRGFCVGADLGLLDSLVARRGADYHMSRPGQVPARFAGLDGPAEAMNAYSFPLALPKPVIAAINGPCVGVGLVLAASCDLRFMSEDAFLSAAFPSLGLSAEWGLPWLLTRIAGLGAASDILMSGRRVNAHDALRIGLATRVVPPDALLAEALDYARAIAAGAAPRALSLIKRQLQAAATQSFAQATTKDYDLLLESLAYPDFAEGVAALRETRPARFSAR
ncbi:MAG: enoyl-CoA hydratase-related protein [Sphingobium sp.]